MLRFLCYLYWFYCTTSVNNGIWILTLTLSSYPLLVKIKRKITFKLFFKPTCDLSKDGRKWGMFAASQPEGLPRGLFFITYSSLNNVGLSVCLSVSQMKVFIWNFSLWNLFFSEIFTPRFSEKILEAKKKKLFRG